MHNTVNNVFLAIGKLNAKTNASLCKVFSGMKSCHGRDNIFKLKGKTFKNL